MPSFPTQADYALSPARRSTGDLQKILDSMMGGRESVLCTELPSLLRAYEIKHGITILDPPDYDNVTKQAESHPDLALDPENVFQFLSICTQIGRAAPPSPTTHHLPHSASLPPTAFRQLQDKTPRAKTHNRRLSDRVRSPSDSSGSSSDEGHHQSTFRPRTGRQQSAPPLPFSSSQSHASLSERALPPLPTHRSMNLADAASKESPLSARIRAAGKGKPPSSFAFNGATSFARPSPASRRRRGSTSGQSASGAEDPKSPDFPVFGRSTSSGSIAIMSSPVMSPTSPRSSTGVDNTSYHAGARSQDGMSDAGAVEDDMGMGGSQHGDEEADEVDELGELQEMDDPRLSRISTESSASLRTSHDKLRVLQKQNTELARKFKDSERQLDVLGSENERLLEDLQDKLEEARAEITQRRKDEKDMKGKERTLMIQISGFEADISSLQRSLEYAKQNHTNMQKMYNSQCDEAQRLRDLLRDRDNTIRDFETEVSAHEADEEKYAGEISAREADLKRLEAELITARRAESHLETHKQENLQLRETIDRMRFDLDEARAAASNGPGHTRGPTTSSGPATLSRNLGDELHRRLVDAERVREEAVEEDADEYVETVVTTQRARKVGGKAANAGGSTTPKAIIRIEEGIREYVDVGTLTDPVVPEPLPEPESDTEPIAGPSSLKGMPAPDEPPAYTRVPDGLSEAEVLLKAHPRDHETGDEVDEDYEALVDSLGMRCVVYEAEMRKREVGRSGGGLVPGSPVATPPGSFSKRRLNSRSSITNYVFYQNDQWGKLAFWAGAALLVGVSLGAHIYSPPSGMHARDYQLFNSMNSLAVGAGVGEGFLPVAGKRVWEVTRMAAGRVPT